MPFSIVMSLQLQKSVIKSHVYLKCPLQIGQIFSVTRTCVHVRWDVREALATVVQKAAMFFKYVTLVLNIEKKHSDISCKYEIKAVKYVCNHFKDETRMGMYGRALS